MDGWVYEWMGAWNDILILCIYADIPLFSNLVSEYIVSCCAVAGFVWYYCSFLAFLLSPCLPLFLNISYVFTY